MPRRALAERDRMSPFARWLKEHMDARGVTMQRVADEAEMHVSQLHKIIKSYLPQYAAYQRPGYEKTLAIGRFFEDVNGALNAANYNDAEMRAGAESRRVALGLPERVSDLPPDLQEALRYILELRPEVRDYMLKLWTEQARPHLEMQADLERRRMQMREEMEAMETANPR